MKVRSTFRFTAPVLTSLISSIPLGVVIYLSGPMTGLEEENKPVFNAAAAYLRSLGYVVINPGETDPTIIDGEPFHLFYLRCILGDILDIRMQGVKYIVTLDDFDLSIGARCELHTASTMGIPTIHHTQVPGMPHFTNLPRMAKAA